MPWSILPVLPIPQPQISPSLPAKRQVATLQCLTVPPSPPTSMLLQPSNKLLVLQVGSKAPATGPAQRDIQGGCQLERQEAQLLGVQKGLSGLQGDVLAIIPAGVRENSCLSIYPSTQATRLPLEL